jgi:hypothetical protein
MSKKRGIKGKFALGTDKVFLVSSWSWSGVENEMLPFQEFEVEQEKYEYGMQKGGQITVKGLYDPDDAAGQALIETAAMDKTAITDARFYIDDINYWTPDADSELLVIKAREMEVSTNNLIPFSATLQVSGVMVLTAE